MAVRYHCTPPYTVSARDPLAAKYATTGDERRCEVPTVRPRALRRVVRAVRRRRQVVEYDPSLPAPPRDRREQIWAVLAPHLTAEDVLAAREDASPGAAAAVLTNDLPSMHRAIVRSAGVYPDLEVRLYRQNRLLKSMPAGSLTLRELESADWLNVGTLRERSGYKIGTDGYLVVLVVHWDADRKRFLALHTRANRVDWTGIFGPARERGQSTGALIGEPDLHRCSPIDAVYTWVDSSDPEWRASHARYSSEHTTENESANNDQRYVNRDELRYSLRSVWMFMPFVRNIYIVTADQRPNWLGDHPRVSVVSHRTIFPSTSALPTFNSHAIETCLHRIPGLSEHFMYFNDDVFLGREINETDLFTLAGLAKVRLSPSAFIYSGMPEPDAIPTDWAAYNSVGLVERDFSLTIRRRLRHVPLPLKKTILQELEQHYSGEIQQTREARFRATSDVAVPSMLAQYYAIATHRAVEWPHGPDEYVYLNTGRTDSRRQYSTIMSRRPKFFCLNATRYDEVSLPEQAEMITTFMQTAFPAPAPWEVD